jgi:hypothetical protein
VLDKLKRLRTYHLKAFHNTTFYPYQDRISDAMIDALLQNLRLTSNATEDDIKKLRSVEVPIEISRQSGKTTAVVLTVEFIMIYLTKMFNRRIHIGIFAPQHEQAKTDFDRLKEALNRSNQLFVVQDTKEQKEFQEQNNSRTLVLPNGSSCYIFPVTKTSKPESKSLDLILFEESQDLDDKIVKEQIWPMGANTNAPQIYVGTAGTRICYFRKIGQTNSAIKLYFEEIAKQRREVYKRNGDALHLVYEQFVRQQIEKHGIDADEIQRPFFGKWLIGTGNFMTEEELSEMESERKVTYQYNKTDCFAGIDVAKHPDSTVVTILRDSGLATEWTLPDGKTKQSAKRKEVLNWLELRGENYQNQFDIIKDFLSHYNVIALAIDSTGIGDYLPDMFENNTEWQDENTGLYRVKFSATSKDMLYKNLKVSVKQLLTTVPKLDTKMGERFKQQMLDLQQEYKGQLLSVHHPDNASVSGVKESDLHDDFPDSLALAEWAFAKWNAENDPQLFVLSGQKERVVKKNDDNEVTDYWPGEDW